MDPAVTTALIAELGKKTSVCWLRYGVYDEPPTQHPVWHVWQDDGLLLVSGGTEQPLPDIDAATRVEVTMRSKETGGRLLTWVGAASRITPDSERWEIATAALATARLSIPSIADTPDDWARDSVVTRIEPTGEVLEQPGTLDTGSHAAAPPPTPAITRGRLPKVLHRRQRRRPRLS